MREGELDVGDVLDGKFRLDALLGEGAMGRVFDARHLFMNRRVAVKLLRGEALRARSAFQRFQQEALAASRIEHPNIVAVLDFGVDRDTQAPYVVQEFLDGLTLLEHLATAPGGRLPPREAIAIVVPVMSALEAAHRKGVVHRDVKPGNVFLVRDEGGRVVPKVIDFGVAKALTPLMQDAAQTRDGQAIGTPLYMSREQAEGVVEVDARTDVWAVGVVLFEMLTGRRPYDGRSATIILGQVLSKEPPPLGSLAPSLDPRLCAAVDGALQTDRARRHPSMQAFLDAVLACADADAPELDALRAASQTPAPVRASRVSSPAAPEPPGAPEPRAPDRGDGHATLAPATTDDAPTDPRRPRRLLAASAAAVTAVALAAALSTGPSPPPPPRPAARVTAMVRDAGAAARDASHDAAVDTSLAHEAGAEDAALPDAARARSRGARPASAPPHRVILVLDVVEVTEEKR